MLSLVFWTLTVIVSLKYVVLILRADNNGEGGLIAMLALASRRCAERPALRRALLVVGMFGTAIFFGDGVITPAISVLSARRRASRSPPRRCTGTWCRSRWLVLTVLFARAAPRHRPGRQVLRPGHAMWFVVLAVLGLPHIAANPAVLRRAEPAPWRCVHVAQPAASPSSRSARWCCA